MSTTISFISGKGGSGKTTLVLSIADLLCRCGIKTLIVDCDFSTNGATFFYESLLKERQITNEPYLYSLSDIVFNSTSNTFDTIQIEPIYIKKNLSFVPSIAYISDEFHATTYYFSKGDIYSKRLQDFIKWSRINYSVILFDCQAGFTDTLYEILPFMDVDLFVLEPDSISASSMRNLHLKIGKKIGSAKVYQVFNKASQEEFDTYSKIVGTFFTNIGTLLFDWKIRQAFSRSQTPDLETVSKQFGYDLCNICKIMITDKEMNTAIFGYLLHLNLLQCIEERESIENKLFDLSNRRSTSLFTNNYANLIFMLTTSALCIGISTYILIAGSSGNVGLLMVMVGVLMSVTLSFILQSLHNTKNDRESRRLYEKQLGLIDSKIRNLKKKDPYYDNDNTDSIL